MVGSGGDGDNEWVVVVKSPPPSFFRVQRVHVTAAAKNSSVQAALLTGRPIREQLGRTMSQRCHSQQKGCFKTEPSSTIRLYRLYKLVCSIVYSVLLEYR